MKLSDGNYNAGYEKCKEELSIVLGKRPELLIITLIYDNIE